MDNPQQDRGADDGLPGIAIAEQAQFGRIGKEAERREDDNQVGDVGDNRAQPVAPGGAEANQLAETFPGVGENTAVEVGANRREQQHGKGEEQDPHAGDAPADKQRGRAGNGCHVLRQTEYTRPQHRAKYQRGQGAKAQFLFHCIPEVIIIKLRIFIWRNRIKMEDCAKARDFT